MHIKKITLIENKFIIFNDLSCINHKEKNYYLILENYIVDSLNNNDCKEGMLILLNALKNIQ